MTERPWHDKGPVGGFVVESPMNVNVGFLK